MPLNRICSSGLPALAASMFCGVEKANYQQHVLLRAPSVPSLAIQTSWQSRRFWWDANCDDISCFCDIGHDVKSAVHMGCVTSGGLVEQFHSPFPLCCAMSSAWKFFTTSAKRCRAARGKYLNAHPRYHRQGRQSCCPLYQMQSMDMLQVMLVD